jgi:hypothetical protein
MTKTASVLEAVANTAYQLRSDVEQREGHVNVKEISPFGAGPRPNNRCGVVCRPWPIGPNRASRVISRAALGLLVQRTFELTGPRFPAPWAVRSTKTLLADSLLQSGCI